MNPPVRTWSFRLALFALWTSVPIVAYGTHLKFISPQYDAYMNEVAAEMTADNPGTDYGPGIGVGLAMAGAWPFVGACLGFGAAVATVGMLMARASTAWQTWARLLLIILVGLFCAWAAIATVSSTYSSATWGFVILGCGEAMSAVGFAFALMAVIASGSSGQSTETVTPSRQTKNPRVRT